ncbi:Ribonucleases P/MRP protein subunit POP1 [Senna tora]|uniref:Ribonucleases P/MRP protein subunit POP1 n=1 Tax=Senna tora TaxID=362788 RepID=A0A834W0Q9_9FABA|nr:Ribonucleases P/MRP protein subunit POP1 [Senna tora]
MVTEGSKRPQVSVTMPPRKINVQKYAESRAVELESLHSIVATRVNSDYRSQRNKRRRTTAFDSRSARKGNRRKRRKLGIFDRNYADLVLEKDHKKKLPRRVRRKLELRMNPESGFCTSGDGTKRLRTHVWHAKRFTMTKLWGYHLPLGLQGRGRGSRALLKRFKQGVLVHDASYCTAVQLEGPEDSLISVLGMVLVSSPVAGNSDDSVLSGVTYGTAMLHGVGAPVSQVIAPVTYMWQPQDTSLKLGGVEHRTTFRQHDMNDEASTYDIDECDKSDRRQGASFRQLWLWIHASAFTEGYDILKLACQKEMEKGGIIIKCLSLEGQLAKLELMGSGAFQLLQKILHPVTGISENHWQLNQGLAMEENYVSQNKRSPLLKNEKHFSSHALLSLVVKDPRELCNKSGTVPEKPTLTEALCDAQQAKSSWSKLEDSYYDNSDLWCATTRGLRAPFEESVISEEKHRKRIVNFFLDDENSVEANYLTKEQCSRSCPIVLLKNDKDEFVIGWSVILPLSWVKTFWIHLVSNGAHAIGLREKHWIACDMGLPFFPSDFPDCKAYSCFMAGKADAVNNKAELRPPSKRPLRVPIPPPWDIVRISFNKETSTVEAPEVSMGEDMTNTNSLPNSCSRSFNISSFESDGHLFDGTVARTGCMLTTYLNEIQSGQLLLFPHVADRKARVSEFLKGEAKLDLGLRKSVIHDRKLCFLRIHLHPYKEGIFEEGAVVCAPRPSDISLWISSNKGLQMSECDMGLYFKEQSSGKWGLHIPDESIATGSHRWPIGFVTTATVKGSKKLIAEGFCEAVLLAHLREEQWRETPAKRRKMEIYVLVRNLTSLAYRLALASIVLEHQENDIDFL